MRRLISLAPWFGSHLQRDIYITLKNQNDPKVPEKMLEAALLRRAAENVRRIMSLQESKPSLAELHQRGAVGDDVWTRFLAAEKIMDAEVMECAGEANAIKPGWAQVMFQSAAEIVHNDKIHERLALVSERHQKEKERMEALRSQAAAELELEK